jgi:hypothetical protein
MKLRWVDFIIGVGTGWLLSGWLRKHESEVTLNDVLRDSFGKPITDAIDSEYEAMNGMPPDVTPIHPAPVSPVMIDTARAAMAYGTGQAIKSTGKTLLDLVFDKPPTRRRSNKKK